VRGLWKSRTHSDYDCDNIKLDGQGPVEEDVCRRHGVVIYAGTTQCRCESTKAKMSTRKRMASTVSNIYLHCTARGIVDPGSYSLTSVIRLGENRRGSGVP
jgi:hypothetical protein